MARYTGPSTKIARKFGEPIFGTDKDFEKRNYPPGQHGLASKRKKKSEYGTQLKEKQKVKYTYGLLERQFRNLYEKASRMKGQKGENLIILLSSTFNNVIVTLTNNIGQVISWSSAGKSGFRGSKKNTPYAAQVAAEDAAKTAYDLGLRKVKAYVKGPGAGRESAIRTIHGAGIEVTEIIDVTPMPHNGCRPKGRRKV